MKKLLLLISLVTGCLKGQGRQAREGKWIGAKYGVFSIAPAGKGRGWIDLAYD